MVRFSFSFLKVERKNQNSYFWGKGKEKRKEKKTHIWNVVVPDNQKGAQTERRRQEQYHKISRTANLYREIVRTKITKSENNLYLRLAWHRGSRVRTQGTSGLSRHDLAVLRPLAAWRQHCLPRLWVLSLSLRMSSSIWFSFLWLRCIIFFLCSWDFRRT